MGVPILDFYYKVELCKSKMTDKKTTLHIDLKILILEFGYEVWRQSISSFQGKNAENLKPSKNINQIIV